MAEQSIHERLKQKYSPPKPEELAARLQAMREGNEDPVLVAFIEEQLKKETDQAKFDLEKTEIKRRCSIIVEGPLFDTVLMREKSRRGDEVINLQPKAKVVSRWKPYSLKNDKGDAVNPFLDCLYNLELKEWLGIVYEPGNTACAEDEYFNEWRGFRHKPGQGNCELYLQLIHEIIANGNANYTKYILDWMAFAIQYPMEPCEVALVLRGGQGAGKGTFARNFGELFAPHYLQVRGIEAITGDYNDNLRAKSVVFLDEVHTKISKSSRAEFNMQISEPTYEVRTKYLSNFYLDNYLHFILASNDPHIISVADDERRFAMFEVRGLDEKDPKHTKQARRAFCKDIVKQLKEENGYAALLGFLLRRDISKFDPRDIPETDEKAIQQIQSANSVERWWLSTLKLGELPELTWEYVYNRGKRWNKDTIRVPIKVLHDHYIAYCSIIGIKPESRFDRIGMCEKLVPLAGITKDERGKYIRKISWNSYEKHNAYDIPKRDDAIVHFMQVKRIQINSEQLMSDPNESDEEYD